MQRPTTFNETLYRNVAYTATLTVTNEDDATVDLTDWTLFWFTAKQNERYDADASAVFQLTSGSGITKLDQNTHEGQLEIAISTANYANLGWEPAVLDCDVQGIDDQGKLVLLMTGKLRVLPHATRATS